MPVVAVVNRKGGSGKSTLATHLAAHCAHSGIAVMLGDVDKQQSTQAWLKLRAGQQVHNPAPIVGWTVDPRSVMRSPSGVTHVVLDTPGGLRGFDLARVVMFADAILMPVCNSVFDRESAADCFAELMSLPRVASGRCQVAAVGMRLDARTKADEILRAWAEEHQIPFIGHLRETQGYVRCVERGLTLFDLPASQVQADLAQWQPILDWVAPLMQQRTAMAAAEPAPARPRAAISAAISAPGSAAGQPAARAARADGTRADGKRADGARPAPVSSPSYGGEVSTIERLASPRTLATLKARTSVAERLGHWLQGFRVTRLLQR